MENGFSGGLFQTLVEDDPVRSELGTEQVRQMLRPSLSVLIYFRSGTWTAQLVAHLFHNDQSSVQLLFIEGGLFLQHALKDDSSQILQNR